MSKKEVDVINHLNNVLLEGVLVTKPEVVARSKEEDQSKYVLAKTRLATDRYYVDKSGGKQVETLFIDVQMWGDLAERAVKSMEKGMTCRVVGRLKMCSWEGENGEKRKSIEIVANHVEFKYTKKLNGKKTEEKVVLDDSEHEGDKVSEKEVVYLI